MPEEQVLSILKEEGVDITVILPCDRTKDFCSLLEAYSETITIMREEDGVGLCAGLCLAGKKPVMHIQSSGLGNMLNAIMSLTVLYNLPLPILASWRGVYEEKIPAQVSFNIHIPGLLDELEIPYTVISDVSELDSVRDVIRDSYTNSRPHVALIVPKVWEFSRCSVEKAEFPSRQRDVELTYKRRFRNPVMRRADAINIIAELLDDECVVSNIGVPGKELYAATDRNKNFYMLGSYTQASPLGFGISLGTKRGVVVLDGDGSLLGTAILPVVAAENPTNLTIVCLDNGAFGSTGNQMTHAWGGVDMELYAITAGITNTQKVHTADELKQVWQNRGDGPCFIHILLKPGNSDAKNIPLSPIEIKERFMDSVNVI
ncbi:sulfopyruvate decarboxylase subunit beta [Methanogenium organophilum]|uniref:sulfopyruvate decarboxylase n=1 Tax=Methanogenium organophilum TaxID=2199 RepID=A0A9X9T7I8_METOG|nr:sulfopyruvate decarboxylase subunit beta [Methanogenium organophilum]WAI00162.1 sulfopyruvate decarboxylase subunit beta [Methanogenium organophilum]